MNLELRFCRQQTICYFWFPWFAIFVIATPFSMREKHLMEYVISYYVNFFRNNSTQIWHPFEIFSSPSSSSKKTGSKISNPDIRSSTIYKTYMNLNGIKKPKLFLKGILSQMVYASHKYLPNLSLSFYWTMSIERWALNIYEKLLKLMNKLGTDSNDDKILCINTNKSIR